MTREKLNRRDFHQLTMAALGGIAAGTIAGCGGKKPPIADPAPPSVDPPSADPKGETPSDPTTEVAANDWTGDTHVCRGLNACKGKGAGGENACAGQGACATAKAHDCHTMNDCKFQGGCGESVGNNACKGKGECAVPLSEKAWKTARTSFESAMAKGEKAIGQPPAPKGDG